MLNFKFQTSLSSRGVLDAMPTHPQPQTLALTHSFFQYYSSVELLSYIRDT